MYTHNTHPCFEWYIPSKSPILRELLNVESGNIIGGFSCIFGRLKVSICKIMAYEGWQGLDFDANQWIDSRRDSRHTIAARIKVDSRERYHD